MVMQKVVNYKREGGGRLELEESFTETLQVVELQTKTTQM